MRPRCNELLVSLCVPSSCSLNCIVDGQYLLSVPQYQTGLQSVLTSIWCLCCSGWECIVDEHYMPSVLAYAGVGEDTTCNSNPVMEVNWRQVCCWFTSIGSR